MVYNKVNIRFFLEAPFSGYGIGDAPKVNHSLFKYDGRVNLFSHEINLVTNLPMVKLKEHGTFVLISHIRLTHSLSYFDVLWMLNKARINKTPRWRQTCVNLILY